jgi:hypothetical protein
MRFWTRAKRVRLCTVDARSSGTQILSASTKTWTSQAPLQKRFNKRLRGNIAAVEGLDALSAEVQERAKSVVLDALGLGRKISTKNVPEEQLVREALEDAKAANVGKGRLGALVAKERPEFVTDGSLFIAREEALDNSPKLRQLLGEVTDPVERFIRTIEDVSRATAAENFYAGLPGLGVERSLMDAVTEFNAGGRPAVVSVSRAFPLWYVRSSDAALPTGGQPHQSRARSAKTE